MDLEDLTAETFAPHRGDAFHVTAADAPAFDLTLDEVTEGAEQGRARRQFSLVFRGGPGTPHPQRIYRLEHDVLGTLEIFLVPIAPDTDGRRYEAVFT
jgi:hypothetical protein